MVTSALRVIGECTRGHPADLVLSRVLSGDRELGEATRRAVMERVWAFYRWRGWLSGEEDLGQALSRAWELDLAYQERSLEVTDAELAARAVPGWVWEVARKDTGWLRGLQRRPILWLRARAGEGRRLAAELGSGAVVYEALPDAVRYSGRGDVRLLPAFLEGRFEVQDLSSQVVGRLCGPRPGERWWDACAGEGGKTVHLSQLMGNRGQIWVTDRAGWRLQRFRRRAARAGATNWQSAVWDGGETTPVPFPCDGVLVDAPCSGLGTWQRHPDARWTTLRSDVDELRELQFRLLRAGAGRVKRGGRLVYSVCTLTWEETEGVADRVDRELEGLVPCPMSDPLVTGSETARVWLRPWAVGGNGMFVSAWKRG